MDFPRSLVLASGNAGKLRELRALLEPLGFELQAQSAWNIPAAEEDRASFLENALVKARHAARLCGRAAIADDSGLVVPSLGGAPGIRSARYAGEDATDADNNRMLLAALAGRRGDERRAFFHCALVLVRDADDPVPLVAGASWWGRVLEAPRGEGGFGYDPLFEVPGQRCSSAELPAGLKNHLSHRGQALRALLAMLQRDHGPA